MKRFGEIRRERERESKREKDGKTAAYMQRLMRGQRHGQ